jgi:hypothetical protein
MYVYIHTYTPTRSSFQFLPTVRSYWNTGLLLSHTVTYSCINIGALEQILHHFQRQTYQTKFYEVSRKEWNATGQFSGQIAQNGVNLYVYRHYGSQILTICSYIPKYLKYWNRAAWTCIAFRVSFPNRTQCLTPLYSGRNVFSTDNRFSAFEN